MLAPMWIRPCSSRMATPTLYFEYGECENSRARRDSASSWSSRSWESSISALLHVGLAQSLRGDGRANEASEQHDRQDVGQSLDQLHGYFATAQAGRQLHAL